MGLPNLLGPVALTRTTTVSDRGDCTLAQKLPRDSKRSFPKVFVSHLRETIHAVHQMLTADTFEANI
eukprot:8408800-Pyramimonas_sp.AAC.3